MQHINVINGLHVKISELEPVDLSDEVLNLLGAQIHNQYLMLFTNSELGFVFYSREDKLVYIGEEDDPKDWKLLHEIDSAHRLQNFYELFRRNEA